MGIIFPLSQKSVTAIQCFLRVQNLNSLKQGRIPIVFSNQCDVNSLVCVLGEYKRMC